MTGVQVEGVVKTDGSTPLTASWAANQTITGIPEPTADSDAANKKYVDDAVTGVQVEGVVKTDGSTPLTDNWNAGNFGITANNFKTPTSNNTFIQIIQDPDIEKKQLIQFAKNSNRAYAAIVGDATDNSIGVYVNRLKTTLKSLSVGTPTEPNHAATKAYVDSRPGGGDVTAAGNNTFTGNNTFNNPVTVGTPTADTHAATKKYADDLNTAMGTRVSGLETEVDGLAAEIEGIDPAGLLKADGSVPLTAAWNAGQKITGIPIATNGSDAANKKYVDDAVSGAGDVTKAGSNIFTGNNVFRGGVNITTGYNIIYPTVINNQACAVTLANIHTPFSINGSKENKLYATLLNNDTIYNIHGYFKLAYQNQLNYNTRLNLNGLVVVGHIFNTNTLIGHVKLTFFDGVVSLTKLDGNVTIGTVYDFYI